MTIMQSVYPLTLADAHLIRQFAAAGETLMQTAIRFNTTVRRIKQILKNR